MKLPIQRVQRDPTLQLRDGGLDMERVEDMRHAIADGVTLPPITVVGDDNLLADGFHRVYAYEAEGHTDIEATHVKGGRDEAIAIALLANSTSLTKPLTRTERNKGVKLLLMAGWTQERIAKETGISRATIVNIGNALAMRGALPKVRAESRPNGGRNPKPVAVLPKQVSEKLGDTVLVRIADNVPVEQQEEFAAAVAAAETTRDGKPVPMPEPRVREAIKDMKTNGLTPAQAVAQHKMSGMLPPVTAYDISKALYRRLKDFLAETVTVKGRGSLDFWQLLDFYASQDNSVSPLGAESLASLLEDVAVRSEAAATRLRMSTTGATNGVAVLP